MSLIDFKRVAVVFEREFSTGNAHSLEAVQVGVQRPEALPGVVAAVGSAHQQLQHQADIDQRDLIVWREVPLKQRWVSTEEGDPNDL